MIQLGDAVSVQEKIKGTKYEDKGIARVIHVSKQFAVLDFDRYKITVSAIELKKKEYILTKLEEDKEMATYSEIRELHEQGLTPEEISGKVGIKKAIIMAALSKSGAVEKKPKAEKEVEQKKSLLTPDRFKGEFCSYEIDENDVVIRHWADDLIIEISRKQFDTFLAELNEVKSYLSEVSNG